MARKKPNTDVEVDMTPMIDLTFLLIIFFIIVNDMTQQELEDLKLPIAIQAGHDDPPPGRPILNVTWFPAGGVPDRIKNRYADAGWMSKMGFGEAGVGVPDNLEWCEIIWKKKVLYYPGIDTLGRVSPIRKGRPDFHWKLAETMSTKFVPHMETKVDPKHPGLGALPDEPILIRADRNTPFKFIQQIMETCTRQSVKIWRVQLAASEPEGAK